MEREANYAAVGAFVLVVALVGALFVYWYSDSREHKIFRRYEIYFDGSVSGLERGAAVRYLGVGVGRVQQMHIDPRDPGRVQVIVDIDSSTPISERTLAQLELQGVTGLLYIDLQQLHPGAQTEPLMRPVQSEDYPVIRSVHSNFDLFLSSLPVLAARAGELATRANRLLSDENIAVLTRLAASLERAGSALPQAARDAGALIAELRSATAESREVIAQLRAASATAAPDLAASMARLRVTADHLAAASEQLDGVLTENRGALRGFMQQGLPQVEALVRDSRDAAREFQQLSKSLRENPSQLLYQPASSGVEIPR